MPLWRIYHPPGTFKSPEERQELSEAVTAIYTAVPLPAFYVVVLFVPLDEGTMFVGGESRPGITVGIAITAETKKKKKHSLKTTPFIRIEIDNIARKLPEGESDRKTGFLKRVDKALKPFIADKEWDWEYHVVETDRSLWKLNGMIPPMPETEDESIWIEQNKAVEYDGAYPPKDEEELKEEQREKEKKEKAKAENKEGGEGGEKKE